VKVPIILGLKEGANPNTYRAQKNRYFYLRMEAEPAPETQNVRFSIESSSIEGKAP
jgi:hypothetical protein